MGDRPRRCGNPSQARAGGGRGTDPGALMMTLRVCGKTAPKGGFSLPREAIELLRPFFDVSGPQNAQIKAFRPVQAAC